MKGYVTDSLVCPLSASGLVHGGCFYVFQDVDLTVDVFQTHSDVTIWEIALLLFVVLLKDLTVCQTQW